MNYYEKYYESNYGKQFLQKFRDAKISVSPPRNFNIDDYYNLGVIKKEDLIDGAYYFGSCRNASIAKWDAKNNCFWYMRSKFTSIFKENINHLADDDGSDVFVPFERIDDSELGDMEIS